MCYHELYKNNLLPIKKSKRIGYCNKYETYITAKQGLHHCFQYDTKKFFIRSIKLCEHFSILNSHPYWQGRCFLVKNYYPFSISDTIDIYTDASYKEKQSKYAFIVFYKNIIIKVQNGIIKDDVKNSNEAEIYAVVKALEYVNKMGFKNKIRLYSDSQKAIRVQYYYYNLNLLDNNNVEFNWIPREKNRLADKACYQAI